MRETIQQTQSPSRMTRIYMWGPGCALSARHSSWHARAAVFFFWIWWADREHACAGRAGEELIVQQVVKGTVIRLRPLMERGTVCFTACGALALSTQWCFIWANGGECRSGVQDLVGITMSCHTPLPAPTLFIHLYPVIRVRLAAFCAIVDVLVIVSKDENVNEGRCVSIKL
jgi:hypothetical protein